VLALMLSASIAVTVQLFKERKSKKALYFAAVALVFGYTFIMNVRSRPDGLIISSIFITLILAMGAMTRWWRSAEFRISGIRFTNEENRARWDELHKLGLPMITFLHYEDLPHKINDFQTRYGQKALLAVHITRHRDPSEFTTTIKVSVTHDKTRNMYVLVVEQAATIANTLAYIGCELHAEIILLGGSHESSFGLFVRKHLTGDGDIGDRVRRLLNARRRHPDHGKGHIPAVDIFTVGKKADDRAHEHVEGSDDPDFARVGGEDEISVAA
jgi:hypothetical protein